MKFTEKKQVFANVIDGQTFSRIFFGLAPIFQFEIFV